MSSAYCYRKFGSMGCKGSCCIEFHNANPLFGKRPTYRDGQKYCAICSVSIVTDVLRCFCCNKKLRTKRRKIDSRSRHE